MRSPSEYTVNATDADELRRSQRRLMSKKLSGAPKKSSRGAAAAVAAAAAESDDLLTDDDDEDEEDDASTPNADSAGERGSRAGLASSLSVRYVAHLGLFGNNTVTLSGRRVVLCSST